MKAEIYGSDHCGFCKQAVALCERKGIQYDYYDVDTGSHLSDLSTRMGSTPRTIPQIYLDNEHVQGGFTGLKTKLANMVIENHDYNESQ